MDDGEPIITEEERTALLAGYEKEREKEIRKAEKRERTFPKTRNLLKIIGVSILAGTIAFNAGWELYNKFKAEKVTQELYIEPREIPSNNYLEGKGLLQKLASDKIISNFGLMQRDADGLVYVVFDTSLGALKKIISNPEEHNLGSNSRREKLYSTLKKSSRVKNGQYIVEFNTEGKISNVYNTHTSLPIDLN